MSRSPRRKYGDLVLILNSTAGWLRSDIFTFDPSTDPSTRWECSQHCQFTVVLNPMQQKTRAKSSAGMTLA
ncbi:hypothetical protein F4823DRAFT_600613 [Ustulina deusta]|nr:hypothetical protein F4823DRAFT_600613 [Ustulina deusta]